MPPQVHHLLPGSPARQHEATHHPGQHQLVLGVVVIERQRLPVDPPVCPSGVRGENRRASNSSRCATTSDFSSIGRSPAAGIDRQTASPMQTPGGIVRMAVCGGVACDGIERARCRCNSSAWSAAAQAATAPAWHDARTASPLQPQRSRRVMAKPDSAAAAMRPPTPPGRHSGSRSHRAGGCAIHRVARHLRASEIR